MKRTLKSTNPKSVNSTTGEKNVKISNKKKGSASAPVKLRQPVDKQFVRSIVEDVEKVLHQRIPSTIANNDAMIQQIKSDLNELLNLLQEDVTQDVRVTHSVHIFPNNTEIKTTDVPHNQNKHDKNMFQETSTSRNKIIPQNKTINNSIIKSNPIQTKPVVEMFQQNMKPTNVVEHTAGSKTHLEIYPCFNISINSTSESEPGVISESNNVQQLTSFWNDRTKNDGPIKHTTQNNFTDHMSDEILTFGHKEIQRNQMVSNLHSNLGQSTLPADLHNTIFCTCNDDKTAPPFEQNYKNNETVLKSVIPISKDMSTNTESTINISHEKLKVTNFNQDDVHVNIIIELIGDFTKNISTLVNLDDDKIEINNKIKEICITLKQSTDSKLINKQTILVSSEKPVTTDRDLSSTNEEFKKHGQNFKCTLTKEEVDKVSDIFYGESPGNSSNTIVTKNQIEGMDYSDTLFSTNQNKYCNEEKELSQSLDVVNETEDMFVFGVAGNNNGVEKNVFVGGGDSSFGQLHSQSSSLKVNLSICSDDNEEQSDFHAHSNISYINDTLNYNQLNRIEDKISKTTSTNNVLQKVSDGSIIQDLRSSKVEATSTDKEEGSKDEDCTFENNYLKHDLINLKINEETLIVNDGNYEQCSSDIPQTNVLNESTLSDTHNIVSECYKIVSKELLQKESRCSEKFSNEIDESTEIDHSVVPNANKDVDMFVINGEHLRMCQEMLNITPSSDLHQSTFNIPLLRSLEEHMFKHDFDYVWQTYQKGGLISERDVLALILYYTIKAKQKSNETSLLSEINRQFQHLKIKTTNLITNCLNTCKQILKSIKVPKIFSNSFAEIFMAQCRDSLGNLTGKEVASFIYHCVISLSMLYLIEEELFGFINNSQILYPF